MRVAGTMYSLDDTIAAIASAPGGAARGIVRVSGPAAAACLHECFRADTATDWAAEHAPVAVAGRIMLPGIPSAVPAQLFFWPDRRSYTRQPIVEIHTLGSPPLLEAILRTICAAGARLAEPGEFTLRAFLAGRMDLTQAEAVLGVIDAADSTELRVALMQLAGGLAAPLHRLRDALLDLLAQLEAGLDFAEEDIQFITRDEIARRLAEAEADAADLVTQMSSRGRAGQARCAALIGRPNTGKSSLFNVLSGGRGALVADHPGTTRDYLVAEVDLDGMRCRLVDTAGLESSGASPAQDGDQISQAAQATTGELQRQAQVEVFCLDAARPLHAWERAKLADAAVDQRIVVLTKCDMPRRTDFDGVALETSSVTGRGITDLRMALRKALLVARGSRGEVVATTAARCHGSLRDAHAGLQRARTLALHGGEELVAAEVRTALEELGRVVGAVYTDDVLDRIFSRFCIGK